MDGSGVWNPQGGSLSAPTPTPLHMGLASGRVVAEILVPSFPPLAGGWQHPGCLCVPRVCEWAQPDLTVLCGVGSDPVGSPT